MCTSKTFHGNPVRGRLNSWLFHMLDGYSQSIYKDHKAKLFSDLPQVLVEIGPGTGANIPYFKKGTQLIAVEPNTYMHERLHRKADKYVVNLEIKNCGAENMEIKSNSVDAVVSTLTLCTILEETKALDEIRRILKPGGKFFFLEHVAAKKGSFLRLIQQLVKRPWFWFFEGCHTHKDITKSIRESGFSEIRMEAFNLYSPFVPIIPQIKGYAQK